MCEIKNEPMFIIFVMTLLIIMWNDGWMVNALACHHGDKGFNYFLWHLVCPLRPTCFKGGIHFTSLGIF